MTSERPIRVRYAAALSGLHAGTIRRWVREGRIRAFGGPNYTCVLLSELQPPIKYNRFQQVAEKTVRRATPAPSPEKP